MPNDAEEPNIVSLGTFGDLKVYFDQKWAFWQSGQIIIFISQKAQIWNELDF